MKTVVITGANRGIGLATAKKFLQNDYRVVGTFREQEIPIDNVNFISVKLDLGSSEGIQKAAKEIGLVAPTIDFLINNAGINCDVNDLKPDIEKIKKTFAVNVFGLIDFTEKLLANIVRGGSIVNISSRYGTFRFAIDGADSTGYRMSKAALNMYTRILAYRLEGEQITVSAIHPGWVKTDMGYAAGDATNQPNIEPEKAADDIYQLATGVQDSGHFWQFGEIGDW